MFAVGIDRYLVKLRLTRAARFHFNHGGVLMGLLCRALRTHELDAGVMPFACESGGVHFAGGDFYNFGLTLAGGARRGFDLAGFGAELARIGAQVPDSHGPMPTLAGNFEVVSVEALPPPNLEEEVGRLKSSASLTLRFLSPFRLERQFALKAKGAGFLNRDCFPPAHFTHRLAKRLFFLAHERYPEPHECDEIVSGLRAAEEATTDARQLLWLDIPLEGAPGKHERQPKGYTLGGVVGRVVFRGVHASWLAPLVLGQYTHAGEKTHYGLGRYRIEECETEKTDAFRPARTAFERLLDTSLLEDSLKYVVARSDAPGVDGYTPGTLAGLGDVLASQASAELRAGLYTPAYLQGFAAPKANARLRPLAVATVRDRMLQHAACTLLGPSVETLLEDCSYAYRKGLSRAGAAQAIGRAYEDGFRYVLDADVESFFDEVEWERMFAKLEALFPFEPLVALIEEWVRAPVVFERTVIRRDRGLPQGVAVSPLLANLYLDEFDEELLGRDYRLVRYGDDFVVLCKDLETAQRAHEDARRKLSEMGLSLNEEKTAIRSFDEGFTYLGYLFCRSLILEKKREAEAPMGALTPEAIPKNSWLARVPFERVRALAARRSGRQISTGASASDRAIEVVPLAPIGTRATEASAGAGGGRPLYVSSFETTVRREGETIIVCAPEQEPVTIPIRELSHVVCYGKVRVTVPVMLALADRGIATYFCRWSGELQAVCGAPAADWTLWTAQARLAEDASARVGFAREVVAAKLHNFAELAVRFKLERASEVAGEIRELERGCENKTTTESLNGVEGRGAALYFGAMRETLDGEWRFEGRRTQPPPDPVNAMLSFGYTLLYNHLSTALTIAGLNPRVGLYHVERGAYHALACDVQEEFRHLVDAQVWAMINRREVKPEDFYATEDGRFPCLLKPEPRKKFIAAFEKRLSSEFTAPGGALMSYRAFMAAQAVQLRDLFKGRVARYRPLRTRGR
ncbi:MAG: CRISPR-associated endonuclease Cas1 [Acidobacteria bacterium]|nr:CRISPR-associated endonuclease Cas1 [Acidobacteriota bacterium]